MYQLYFTYYAELNIVMSYSLVIKWQLKVNAVASQAFVAVICHFLNYIHKCRRVDSVYMILLFKADVNSSLNIFYIMPYKYFHILFVDLKMTG
jgi:hypothetical protein